MILKFELGLCLRLCASKIFALLKDYLVKTKQDTYRFRKPGKDKTGKDEVGEIPRGKARVMAYLISLCLGTDIDSGENCINFGSVDVYTQVLGCILKKDCTLEEVEAWYRTKVVTMANTRGGGPRPFDKQNPLGHKTRCGFPAPSTAQGNFKTATEEEFQNFRVEAANTLKKKLKNISGTVLARCEGKFCTTTLKN